MNLHPEIKKEMETCNFLLEHNLPVEKEMLFWLMPEMFRKEINKLNYENKQKFKFQRLEFFRSDTDTLDHDKFDSK